MVPRVAPLARFDAAGRLEPNDKIPITTIVSATAIAAGERVLSPEQQRGEHGFEIRRHEPLRSLTHTVEKWATRSGSGFETNEERVTSYTRCGVGI
jgi:hypothetical protein